MKTGRALVVVAGEGEGWSVAYAYIRQGIDDVQCICDVKCILISANHKKNKCSKGVWPEEGSTNTVLATNAGF